MIAYRFKVGQVVRPSTAAHNLPRATFRILRLLPSTAGGMPLYCIRREGEMIERVVEQVEIEAEPG